LFEVAADEVFELDYEIRIVNFVCMVEKQTVKEASGLGQTELGIQIFCIITTDSEVIYDSCHCFLGY
jgi:hypothetical protein